jgi:hypothetical protein
MEVCKSAPVFRKLVDVWSFDFSAIATNIGESKIICKDDQEVGATW